MRADRLLLATCNRSRGDGTRYGRTGEVSHEDRARRGNGTDGPWSLNESLGIPAPPWWTRDWLGPQ
ncbi:hypothetical protein SAMN04488546_2002 [Geodermatophilus poikilotrophus]|uniref:Uncharacterized protein n=1 Tax=Geodermatophilus poikilotrophus TaxID=1333667 RepID=A0A1I0DMX2_9ACTN|nr:hypothetical protein SAMN04488546_2002 [Geodermatophilus poikilotrophus]